MLHFIAGKEAGIVSLHPAPIRFFPDRQLNAALNEHPLQQPTRIHPAWTAIGTDMGHGPRFSNFPMTFDEKSKRLFIVCRIPARCS